jgi:hypothetical protein
MARDPAPIPDDFLPTVVPRRPASAIDALEDEIAEHIHTMKSTTTKEQAPMQDRPAPATPPPPASPYAPPPPRPVSIPTAIQNQPQPPPASQMDVRFNGKTLILSATCNTSAEAERVIETLQPLSKLLPSE